jgi:hypothetical protein
VIVFGLGKNLLFKSVKGHCGIQRLIQNLQYEYSQFFEQLE